jgi:hypothetical protein
MLDQFCHHKALLLGGNTALLLPMQRFLTFVIRRQALKICGKQLCFVRFRLRLRRSDTVRSMLATKKTLLDACNCIRQNSTCPSADAGRLGFRLGERSDKIGAADDTDDSPVTDHRDALYAVRGQQPRNLVDLGVLADRDDRRRHDIACSLFWSAEACEKIGVQHLSFCKQSQPPVAAGLTVGLVTADQVTLADHAEG